MPLAMSTGKSKKATIDKLYEQFQMYGLTTDISYEKYVEQVDAPVTRRVLQKLFMGRWVRAMSALSKYYPDVNELGNAPLRKNPEPAPEIMEDPLEGLSKVSVADEEDED